MPRWRLNTIKVVAMAMAVLASQTSNAETRQVQWFRGNTHAHTVLCGHADSTPEAVAKWYHDHGYHFLVLSEHNKFIDPATVKLPDEARKDFILVPGQEITGQHHIHTTAMNTRELVPWKQLRPSKAATILYHVQGAKKAGGEAILNHPNYHYAVGADDMTPIQELRMFELYNGHPSVNNYGNEKFPSTEVIWDVLLTRGKQIYGVSSDDAHHFKTIAPEKSNPGRGWVMVKAKELTPDAITDAMRAGDFYASSGVFLSRCERGEKALEIEVDIEATKQALKSDPLLRGKSLKEGEGGVRIDFIGTEGKILKSFNTSKASFPIDPEQKYIRAKATFINVHPKYGLEAYYAWSQPVFKSGEVVEKAEEK